VSASERDPLDLLLAGAARFDDRDLAADPALRQVLDELCAEVVASVRPRHRLWSRQHRMTLAVAVVTALVLCAVPVLGRLHGASPATAPPHVTGWLQSAGGGQLLPDGPGLPGTWELRGDVGWVDLSGPQLPAVIDSLGRQIPLPVGGSWSFVKAHLPGTGWTRTNQLGETLIRQASCEWEYYWLDRDGHGDAVRAGEAWRGLRSVSPWILVTPDEGAGITTKMLAYGAARPDPALIREDLQAGCRPEMWSR
jgi:hypothetical protein